MLINSIFEIKSNQDIDIYCIQKLYQDKYNYLKVIYTNLTKSNGDYLIYKYLTRLVTLFLLNPTVFEVTEFIEDLKKCDTCATKLFTIMLDKSKYGTLLDVIDNLLNMSNTNFKDYYFILSFLIKNKICCEIIVNKHEDDFNKCYIDKLLSLIIDQSDISLCHNIIKIFYKNESISFLSFCNTKLIKYKYLLKLDSLLIPPENLLKDYSDIHNLLQILLYVWSINNLQDNVKSHIQNKLWLIFNAFINIGINSLYILRTEYMKINNELKLMHTYVHDDRSFVVAVIDNHLNDQINNYDNHIKKIDTLIDLIDIESYTYFYNKTCEYINSLILTDSFNELHLKHNYIVSNINLFFHEHLENNPNIQSSILIKYFFNLLNLSYIPLLNRTDYINTLFTVLLKTNDMSGVSSKCFDILINYYIEYNASELIDFEKEVIHYKIILIMKLLLMSPALETSFLVLFDRSNPSIIKYVILLLDDFKNVLDGFFYKIKTYNSGNLPILEKITKKNDISKIAYTINTYLYLLEQISHYHNSILLHEQVINHFITICNYYINIILTKGSTIYSLIAFRLNSSTYNDILIGIVKCYANLKYNTVFINNLFKNVNDNVETLIDDLLIKIKYKMPVQLEIQLIHIRNKLNLKFESNKTNITPTMYDPIMHTKIQIPIHLPDSKIIMDKSVILQHLNNSETDPFTRCKLTVDILEEHNKLDSTKDEITAEYAKHAVNIKHAVGVNV